MTDKPDEPDVQAVIGELAGQSVQNMADLASMATSLSGLQDEMAVVNTPAANQFKPLWLVAAVAVAVIIGGGTFIGVQRLTEVDKNSKAISDACEIRNEALTVINQKFEELNILIGVSLVDVDPNDPKARDFIVAFEKLRKPIPLKPCEENP